MSLRCWTCFSVLLAAPLGSACEGANADERIELFVEDLPASSGEAPTGAWQSVGWAGTDAWQRYPGRATLVLHHELAREPTIVLVYLAFDDTGDGAGLATGDMARVVEVTDTTVTVRNDTEANFFCRVVLE